MPFVSRKTLADRKQEVPFLSWAVRQSVFPRYKAYLKGDGAFCRYPEIKSWDLVPLHIAVTTADHISFWSNNVQPVIDSMHENFLNHKDENIEKQCRADYKWNWYILYSLAFSLNILNNRDAFFCKYEMRTLGFFAGTFARSEWLPCALMLTVGNWPVQVAEGVEETEKTLLLWFISTAPGSVFKKTDSMPTDPPANLFCWGLHTAIVMSEERGARGKVHLHAASGPCQENLIATYGKKIGMEQVPGDGPPPGVVRTCKPRYKTNDGAFFKFTPESAHQFQSKMDQFR